jgi:ABC-type lipoprotein export system ATPase subunit
VKKIDLHIHTVPATGKDTSFEFSLTDFQGYIAEMALDAVAITNHNLFDIDQFKTIESALGNVVVFPGIEIDFEDGHLLLITESKDIDDFATKCELVTDEHANEGKISGAKLVEFFGDLSKYLLIPHYDKTPVVSQKFLDLLNGHIFAGEVQSPKKFYRLIKDGSSLTPVKFSDARIKKSMDLELHQGKHTYIKTAAQPLTLSAVKAALTDKNKVFLTASEKHDFFEVFSDGQELSHGLNVILGSRSSGKTHFLNRLEETFTSKANAIKYIKQFDLVKIDEDEFNTLLENERSVAREKYLNKFKQVTNDVSLINRAETHFKLERYVETLLKYAKSEKLQDEYSKAFLFKETPYTIRIDEGIKDLLLAVRLLQNDQVHKITISKHLPEASLNALFTDLSLEYRLRTLEIIKREWVNELVDVTSKQLKSRSSSPSIEHNDIDLFDIQLEKEKIRRFNAIGKAVKKTAVIDQKVSGKFSIEAVAGPYSGAGELKDESGKRSVRFSDAFGSYTSPYFYLEKLKGLGLQQAELYRYFCKVRYHVLNEYGKPVSGGERAEFNLLKALDDARQFEMVLVDEPESSFDNVFLKDSVNKVIKDLSKELPVVVVTHNNTVGMLLQPDYILYTKREINAGIDEYFVYSGSPGEKEFKTADGAKKLDSHTVLLESLEAGAEAYALRNKLYENFKK